MSLGGGRLVKVSRASHGAAADRDTDRVVAVVAHEVDDGVVVTAALGAGRRRACMRQGRRGEIGAPPCASRASRSTCS